MRWAPARLYASSVLALAVVLAAASPACSGSSATAIGNSGAVDAGGASNDGATSNDASSTDDSSVDASERDGGRDAGVVVTEQDAPGCHDLQQKGAKVTAIGDPNPAPDQVQITTITPGLYVLVSEIDYGGVEPVPPGNVSRTTLFFTATRQYYLSENATGGGAGNSQVYTLDWKIQNNRLIRKIVCAEQPSSIGQMVDYRIDGQPNGFILYVPVNIGAGMTRLEAFKYDRVP